MDGILNINKPRGRTSYQIVALVKRLSGERRVGHAGTLDPEASGVLPVCLGQATRVIEYLFDQSKKYRAQIELGKTTDSYDSAGNIMQTGDPSGITRAMVENALVSFIGLISQTPPMYSAVKQHGKPLYLLARKGIEVERKSRPARIYSLEIREWEPPLFTLDVVCGKGTYIRSLAHDLGQALGCGAYLKQLVRLRCGPFTTEDSVSVEELEEKFRSESWQDLLYPPDIVLTHYDAVLLNEIHSQAIRNGVTVPLSLNKNIIESEGSLVDIRLRAYDDSGRFIAILSFNRETGYARPEKVFPQSCDGCDRPCHNAESRTESCPFRAKPEIPDQ
jgi:tRNA pseudouridine55 synthase